MPSPQLESIVQMLRSRPALAEVDISAARANFETIAGLFPPQPDVRSEKADAGGVPAEWIAAPGADDERVVLYLHGGGYMIGSVNTHRDMIGRISRAAGARALAIEYRLAPEHPFPAAVEDAVTAYRWLLKNGVRPSRAV